MALPLPPNTTCDLYRLGNAPPSSPDLAAVAGYLRPDWRAGQEAGDRTDASAELVWTHVLLVDVAVDVRDGYLGGQAFNPQDTVYIPDKDGTPFRVVFVERVQRGLPSEHKRVYLDRQLPTWPADEL